MVCRCLLGPFHLWCRLIHYFSVFFLEELWLIENGALRPLPTTVSRLSCNLHLVVFVLWNRVCLWGITSADDLLVPLIGMKWTLYLFSHVPSMTAICLESMFLFFRPKEMPVFGSEVHFFKETRRWFLLFFFFIFYNSIYQSVSLTGEVRLLIFRVIIESCVWIPCWCWSVKFYYFFLSLHQYYFSMIYYFLWPHGSILFFTSAKEFFQVCFVRYLGGNKFL